MYAFKIISNVTNINILDCGNSNPHFLQRKPSPRFVSDSSKENDKSDFNKMSALYKSSPGYFCLDAKPMVLI